MDPNERVLCVPTSAVRQIGDFQGFDPDWQKYVHNLLRPETASFIERGKCETNPEVKQIIPYLVFRYFDLDLFQFHVLRYTRTKMAGEKRLHAKVSIGIGGHINPVDGNNAIEAFSAGWHRELAEEVRCDTKYNASIAGVINDDSEPVGAVHLGVMIRIDVNKPCVYPKDESTQEMYFARLGPLVQLARQKKDEFEGWSNILLWDVVLSQLYPQNLESC